MNIQCHTRTHHCNLTHVTATCSGNYFSPISLSSSVTLQSLILQQVESLKRFEQPWRKSNYNLWFRFRNRLPISLMTFSFSFMASLNETIEGRCWCSKCARMIMTIYSLPVYQMDSSHYIYMVFRRFQLRWILLGVFELEFSILSDAKFKSNKDRLLFTTTVHQ